MTINRKLYNAAGKYLLLLVLMAAISGCSSLSSRGTAVFDPEASFKKANDLIEGGHYEDAREVLEDIKARDASRNYATLAGVRIADTYFENREYEEAAAEYENFLGMHPYHKYSSYAQYKMAMCYYRRIGTVDVSYSWAATALEEFEKLLTRYPRNPYIEVVEKRIRACRQILAEYEFYVGKFYFKKGSYEAAALRFDGLVRNYADSKKESDAFYYLALSYENMGRRDEAVNTLSALIKKYPTIKLSVEARALIDSFNNEK